MDRLIYLILKVLNYRRCGSNKTTAMNGAEGVWVRSDEGRRESKGEGGKKETIRKAGKRMRKMRLFRERSFGIR